MAKRSEEARASLVIPRDEVKQQILSQIERAKEVPDISVNENQEARNWYEFTAELLRQIFSTDQLSDEFTGRGKISFSGADIRTSNYLRKLQSIYQRIDLYPEQLSQPPDNSTARPIELVEIIIKRFHAVARQLRQRHDSRSTLEITDEYDVQDLFHALLQLYFDDIRPEEWTPSYAGGSSRMDFLLKAEKVVIELKKTRPNLNRRETGEQLSIDIVRYRVHPDCRTLICLVYDPEERIQNPRGLEQDLSNPIGEMDVKVYIVQR